MNDKVKIFRYVTEGTFDSYSWQLIENKQKFIGQIMTSKSPVRSCEDIDEAALTYAEVKALATGNPYIKEKMDLDIQVSKLKLLKANHTSQKYRLEDNIVKHYPVQIASMKERLAGYRADIQTYAQNKFPDKDTFSIKIGNRVSSVFPASGLEIKCRKIHSFSRKEIQHVFIKLLRVNSFQTLIILFSEFIQRRMFTIHKIVIHSNRMRLQAMSRKLNR